MRRVDLYGASIRPDDAQAVQQAPSGPTSAARDTAPKAPRMGDQAVTISWLGVVLALVLIRIVYEISE